MTACARLRKPANLIEKMSRQIGQFFLFIGLLVLVIFFATNQINEPAWGYCCSGLSLVGIAFYLLFRSRPHSATGARFRAIRRLRGRGEKTKK